MRKNSFWLFGIALLSVIALVALLVYPKLKEDGQMVRIRQNQTVLHLLPLSEDITLPIEDSAGGYNVVVIENGLVRIESADCPDQVCVRHGATNQTNDPIVCLPHRLEVSVLSTEAPEIDGVAQ